MNMKKLVFSITFSILLLIQPTPAKAVSLGGLEVNLSFCSQVSKLAGILQAYTIVQWPVAGVPGITMGMLSNNSVVLDFCDFLTQLEQMDTTNAVFFSAQYLNQLTNKKWDDNFKQIDRMWNLTNSLVDLETGTYRQGALESASTHREINDFIKDSSDWYSNRFNGTDSDIKTRSEREAQVNSLARISYQRALLKEATNCPEPNTDINYANLYSKQVAPLEKARDEAQEDMQFYKDFLYSMGSKLSANASEATQYYADLEKLPLLGVTYKQVSSKGEKTTYKPKKSGSGANATVTQEKQTIDTVVQTTTAVQNDEYFNAFKNAYADKWKTWVTAQWVSQGSYGLLDDPEAKVVAEFKDISSECNKSRIARKLDDTKSTFEKDLEAEFKRCQDNVNVNQKNSENLLNYYLTKYSNAIYAYKNNSAKMWSFESKYLGRNRSISQNTSTDNFQQEEVKCEANLQPIEMEKLKLKLQNVEAELNQQIATESFKQTVMMQEQQNQQQKVMKEANSRNSMIELHSNSTRKMLKQNGTLITPINRSGK